MSNVTKPQKKPNLPLLNLEIIKKTKTHKIRTVSFRVEPLRINTRTNTYENRISSCDSRNEKSRSNISQLFSRQRTKENSTTFTGSSGRGKSPRKDALGNVISKDVKSQMVTFIDEIYPAIPLVKFIYIDTKDVVTNDKSRKSIRQKNFINNDKTHRVCCSDGCYII